MPTLRALPMRSSSNSRRTDILAGLTTEQAEDCPLSPPETPLAENGTTDLQFKFHLADADDDMKKYPAVTSSSSSSSLSSSSPFDKLVYVIVVAMMACAGHVSLAVCCVLYLLTSRNVVSATTTLIVCVGALSVCAHAWQCNGHSKNPVVVLSAVLYANVCLGLVKHTWLVADSTGKC